MKKRFSSAKIGDPVTHVLFGPGKVINTDVDHIRVEFKITRACFDLNGGIVDIGQLFYADSRGQPSNIRPINWAKVKPGTRFNVWDDPECPIPNPVAEFRFFAEEKPWFKIPTRDGVHTFEFCRELPNP